MITDEEMLKRITKIAKILDSLGFVELTTYEYENMQFTPPNVYLIIDTDVQFYFKTTEQHSYVFVYQATVDNLCVFDVVTIVLSIRMPTTEDISNAIVLYG